MSSITVSQGLEPRQGVVTLFGYGTSVRVDKGHLILEDGIGNDRRQARFSRVGHGLRRLVVIGSDGMVSLAALRWLADQDASFVMLDRDGSVLATTGPVRSSDAKLRRAQSLAASNGFGLRIARDLINKKLSGQEQVARQKLLDGSTAETIAKYRSEIPQADSISTIRLIESQAARAYWSAWSALPVNFPKVALARVPDHWRKFGARVSPLTGSPRLAANPANAILNYLYCMLESEARLAIAALGLDPGLGILHVDTTARDSLACDVMEPVRSVVDSYVLDWITRQPLKREWFFEQRDGNCRLMASLAVRLSETASLWRQAVAPIAEWLARAIWSTIDKPRIPLATRLTQTNKRHAKRGAIPVSPHTPQPENVCLECGKVVATDSARCVSCARESFGDRMREISKQGRIASKSPQSRARLSATQHRQANARWNWNASGQPAWLSEDTYKSRIQPLLKNASLSQIGSTMGVSVTYASEIRKGKRCPHPRHWQALADLCGVALIG